MTTDSAEDTPAPVEKIDRLTYASEMLGAIMIIVEEGSLLRLLISAAKAEADLGVNRACKGVISTLKQLQH